MKKTKLISDLYDVYYSLPCEDKNNESSANCECCKNSEVCSKILNIIDYIENNL